MIVYFADRQLNILGQASTSLPKGLTVIEDLKTEDVETGVAIFECKIPFDKNTRADVEAYTEVGNYVLRSNDKENEFYQIIEAEIDTKNQEVYIYAEDDGMDLLNEVVGEYEADKAYPISHYIEKYASGAGFVIGINEVASLTRKLSWDGESTATERIASVATQFDGCEVSYSFEIDGLTVTKKYINFYKERGKDIGIPLRLNQDVDRIVTTKSIANLATALQCTGGTPENKNKPITLKNYSYDDGDFYVDGTILKSRKALERWSRYLWKDGATLEAGGHIVKQYSYDTTNQQTLCSHAITELKKICDMEVNYEVDINKLPENVKVGDRVNIVDDEGELYLSTRILKLETSIADQNHKATLGEFLIKGSGISQKVIDLAAQFATVNSVAMSASATAMLAQAQADAALLQAQEAHEIAEAVQAEVEGAFTGSVEALEKANEALEAANNAKDSATEAQTKANNAQAAVDTVEKSVASMEENINKANTAANEAKTASGEAQAKADEAAQAAAQAKADAANASAAVVVAQGKAETATTKAEEAIGTAEIAKGEAATAKATADAAKLDAQKAEEEIATLGERLETVSHTMQADYARKTDLTEAEAHLQSQITQNAAMISSTVSMMSTIDETANDAQTQAEKAQKRAQAAREQANQASADAIAAQDAADEAAQAAANAQAEADTAKAAANSAKAISDQAEANLATAKANLEAVLSRGNATEAEIAAARAAVEAAQTAANKAKADSDAAAKTAAEAQETADTAAINANNAQATANAAADYAKIAQSVANEAQNAVAAQTTADEAVTAAANAQATADSAVSNAADAQAKADAAEQAARDAQAAADDADAKAAKAESDLKAAEANLAEVTSRVGATEAEIAAAQTAVTTAKAAADKAKEEAEAAQATADDAQLAATNAQYAADIAQTAANNAQKAADDAQDAADQAQAAVDALAVRVTTAETKITQTSEQITLLATKEEVAKFEVGGRNLLLNSSFEESFENWNNIEAEITTIDGVDCAHIVSATGTMTSVSQDIISKLEVNDLEQTYVISADIRLDNFVAGTSPLVEFRFSGSYDDNGTSRWLGATTVSGSRDFSALNNAGWVRTSCIVRFAQVPTAMTLLIYANDFSGDLYFKNVKLEKGNKATDWTPAPEDVDGKIDAVNDGLVETIKNQQTSIVETCEDIVLTATESLVEKSEYETFKSETSASLGVNAEKIEMNFTANAEAINSVDSDLQTKFNQLYKHISFSQNGITISGGENTITLTIDTDGIVFSKNGVAFGSWDGVDFHTGNVVVNVNERAQFGNFAYIPRSDGSLMFLKVGG